MSAAPEHPKRASAERRGRFPKLYINGMRLFFAIDPADNLDMASRDGETTHYHKMDRQDAIELARWILDNIGNGEQP